MPCHIPQPCVLVSEFVHHCHTAQELVLQHRLMHCSFDETSLCAIRFEHAMPVLFAGKLQFDDGRARCKVANIIASLTIVNGLHNASTPIGPWPLCKFFFKILASLRVILFRFFFCGHNSPVDLEHVERKKGRRLDMHRPEVGSSVFAIFFNSLFFART